MPKKEKRLVQMLIAGIVILAFVLTILTYYFFFYRKDSPITDKDYSPAKHVLFISSYSESFETVDLQKAGIRRRSATAILSLILNIWI